MVCRDQVLFADFTKKGVNGAYTHTPNILSTQHPGQLAARLCRDHIDR
jgi:hypothetical protein